MKWFLSLVLILLWALTQASTFELQDPAAQVLEEQQPVEGPEEARPSLRDAVCTVDLDTRDCSCRDKESGDEIALTSDECLAAIAGTPKD
jgi:hypothetical protein